MYHNNNTASTNRAETAFGQSLTRQASSTSRQNSVEPLLHNTDRQFSTRSISFENPTFNGATPFRVEKRVVYEYGDPFPPDSGRSDSNNLGFREPRRHRNDRSRMPSYAQVDRVSRTSTTTGEPSRKHITGTIPPYAQVNRLRSQPDHSPNMKPVDDNLPYDKYDKFQRFEINQQPEVRNSDPPPEYDALAEKEKLAAILY